MDLQNTRTLELDYARADEAQRTVPLVLSSETPVPRGGYDEVLDHGPGSIDLGTGSLPLLVGHDTSPVPVATVENLHVTPDRKLRGVARFGTSARAREVFADVKAGVIRAASVGYRIVDYITQGNTLRATRWQPYEVSAVGVGADPAAGFFRSRSPHIEGFDSMNENEGQPATDAVHLSRSQRRAANAPDAATLAVEAERQRVADLNAGAEALKNHDGIRSLADTAIRDGWSMDQFRVGALQLMANKPTEIYAVGPEGGAGTFVGYRTGPSGAWPSASDLSLSGSFERDNPLACALRNGGIDALLRGRTRSAVIPLPGSITTLRRALVSDAAGGITTPPEMLQGFTNAPQRALMLLDLLPRLAVSSGSFEFNQLTAAFAHAAGYQATQGASKPAQSVPMQLVSVPIATIAVVAGISEQALRDAPALQQRIGDLLRYGVMQKLESEIVAGAGPITGLKTSGTAFTQSVGASNVDAIGEAASHLQNIGWQPSAVLLNPTDWHAIRVAKSSGSGEYMAGTFDAPATPNVWGTPVITTPSLTAGTAIVLDTSQALLLDREGAALQVGYDGNGFTQNVLTVRAELRAGLAVQAPTAVAVLTLT